MSGESSFTEVLLPILSDLEPHLNSLLVIGGWVPQLHRHASDRADWQVTPLHTTELDILITAEAPTLAKSLKEAGFDVVGDPASSAVWERDVAKGERVELFVHHQGTFSTTHTTHSLALSDGLNAIALPQLDVLRAHSVVLSIEPPAEVHLPSPIRVRVPELAIFAAHKGGIFFRRTDSARKIKDLHYIVELMQSGAAVIDRIERDLGRYCVSGGAAAKLIRTARNNISLIVGDEYSLLARGLGEAVAEHNKLAPEKARARAIGLLADFVDIVPPDCG